MTRPPSTDTVSGIALGLSKRQVRRLGGTERLRLMSPEALRLLVNRVKTNSDNRGGGGGRVERKRRRMEMLTP